MSIMVATPDGHTAEFPDGTDPTVIQSAMAKQFGAPKRAPQAINADPTADMSTMDKLMAGAGQGVSSGAGGMLQMIAHHPEMLPPGLGNALQTFAPDLGKNVDAELQKRVGVDKPLLDTGAGQVGSLLGNAAITAPLAGGGKAAGLLGTLAKGAQIGAGGALAQPVTSGDYDTEKAKQLATGAGIGAGTNTALYGAGKLVEKLMPANLGGTALNAFGGKAADTPFAQEGEQLAQRTGIDFTPGQVTGSKGQTALENRVRQLAASSDIAAQGDQKRATQWVDYVHRTINGLGSSGGTTGEVGERVQGVVKNAVDDLTNSRNSLADKEYGAIRDLVQGKPAVIPQNYMQTLQELGQQFAGGPEGSDYAKLSKTLGSLQENGLQNADISTMMKTRRFLSQVAGGQVQLAGDTGRGMQKSIATQLLGAIDQDLDASAQKIGGPVGELLQKANANYRNSSQAIEGLQNSALGKVVGQDFANAVGNGTFNQIPGETVMQRLGAMQPSQIATAKGILQKYSPDALQDIKANMVENALKASQNATASDGANALAARPGVFYNMLGKTPDAQQKLAAWFEPKELNQMQDAFAAAKRLSDKTGTNFSGTASAIQSYEYARAIGSLLMGNPAPLAGLTGLSLSAKSVAKVMTNSQGRALVKQMASLPAGSDRVRQLATQLAAIAGTEEVQQSGQSGQP
jgi:hypothetical protein